MNEYDTMTTRQHSYATKTYSLLPRSAAEDRTANTGEREWNKKRMRERREEIKK